MRGLLVAATLFTATTALAGSVQVVNLGADFRLFLEAAKAQTTFESKRRAWDLLETRHQALYDQVVFGKDEDPNWEKKREKKLAAFFNSLLSIEQKMIDLFDRADDLVQTHSDQFNRFFPDMPDGLTVYAMPSLMSFNGFVGHLDGEKNPLLFLGFDVIALRNDNLDLLFSHEFFHVYHFSKDLKAWSDFASPLWFEGFATYVSGVLNPGASDSDLLMDSELGARCANSAERSEWARTYLEILHVDGNSVKAADIYSDWFLMNGTYPQKRRGYCLGLHVLKKLGSSHSMNEMALWSEDRFGSEAEAALKQLAQSK